MSRTPTQTVTSEATLLGRILAKGTAEFPGNLARYLLTIGFSSEDKARMHELAVSNQAGVLSPEEKAELLRYANVGCVLGILQSRARKSLKKPKAKPTS